MSPTAARLRRLALPLALTLLAWGLRLVALDQVPPGWRDDELSNSLVISQHVLDGDWRLFYPDASGHEFLYHAVAAGLIELFGLNLWGIRLLSIALGVGVSLLIYRLTRQLFGEAAALIAAWGVTTSFWSLMYSRVGMRHISAAFVALLTLWLLWRILASRRASPRRSSAWALLTGLAMGVGFYTYFASRIVPAIVLALGLYLALFDREGWRRHRRELALTLLVAGLLFLPLWWSAQNTPGAEARIGEVAKPLHAARQGNWGELARHVRVTLSMFHADGDDEWLYNIPHRPTFGPLGAMLFFAGLLLIVTESAKPLRRGQANPRYAFLLIWLLGASLPGALSTPPASLGHTILALPVAYVLPALAWVRGFGWLGRRTSSPVRRGLRVGWLALLIAFLATESYRGLRDYFHVWPQEGYVRFLHHAAYHDLAAYLNEQAPGGCDLAVAGGLVEPWEQEALNIDLKSDEGRPQPWQVRWFDPRHALLVPAQGGLVALTDFPPVDPALASQHASLLTRQVEAEAFELYTALPIPLSPPLARFDNGLTLHGFSDYELDGDELVFSTLWSVESPLDLPPNPLVSKPPPPGVAVGPRLAIFTHLVDDQGTYLSGQDGLGVDPYTLKPGDRFIHLHRLSYPAARGSTRAVRLGLYDPRTGNRWLIQPGEDNLLLFTIEGFDKRPVP